MSLRVDDFEDPYDNVKIVMGRPDLLIACSKSRNKMSRINLVYLVYDVGNKLDMVRKDEKLIKIIW